MKPVCSFFLLILSFSFSPVLAATSKNCFQELKSGFHRGLVAPKTDSVDDLKESVKSLKERIATELPSAEIKKQYARLYASIEKIEAKCFGLDSELNNLIAETRQTLADQLPTTMPAGNPKIKDTDDPRGPVR